MNYKHGCTIVGERKASNPKWRAHYVWVALKQRCDNEKDTDYPNYGGRGITYDPSWNDFASFLADMGCPPLGMSIDRKDNDAPYSKANCRWATKTEQNRNRRMNHYLEYAGKRMIIAEWAEELGVKPRLLRVRLNRGWSVEDTLSRPCDPTVGRFA